jgi:hypothetical protein
LEIPRLSGEHVLLGLESDEFGDKVVQVEFVFPPRIRIVVWLDFEHGFVPGDHDVDAVATIICGQDVHGLIHQLLQLTFLINKQSQQCMCQLYVVF